MELHVHVLDFISIVSRSNGYNESSSTIEIGNYSHSFVNCTSFLYVGWNYTNGDLDLSSYSSHSYYRNPSLEFATKARAYNQIKACKGVGQEWSSRVTFHALGSVREWTSTLSSELPLWELESRWTPKFSKNNYKGQNPFNWKVLYIIGNLLDRRCLRWACMTHLGT